VQNGSVQLLVVADDRTGALETAGALADRLGREVPALAGETAIGWVLDGTAADSATQAVVIDLGTRHLTPDAAARRATLVDARRRPSRLDAHKIDSTLRGNWAHELAARHRVSDAPVLVVAALPALGRVCVGGEVRQDGRPVHEGPSADDVSAFTNSSRVDHHLMGAGCEAVHGISAVTDLRRWLRSPSGVAVCDAETDRDLDAITGAWTQAARPVLLAGTSAVIAAAGHALARSSAAAVKLAPPIEAPALVVCGSVHPSARAQLARLAASCVVIVTTPLPSNGLSTVDARAAARTAESLGTAAHRLIARMGCATVITIGGDTTAALLGDAPVVVGGSLAPGTPWGRQRPAGPLIVSRSGGFGGPDALVDLLWGTLAW
jgi:D-threonate/D-erythronate kinase